MRRIAVMFLSLVLTAGAFGARPWEMLPQSGARPVATPAPPPPPPPPPDKPLFSDPGANATQKQDTTSLGVNGVPQPAPIPAPKVPMRPGPIAPYSAPPPAHKPA